MIQLVVETLPSGKRKVPAWSDAEGWATLTEQQAASGRGPADLHVVDLHVLGNVLHWDLLRDLKPNKQQNSHQAALSFWDGGQKTSNSRQNRVGVREVTFISKQALPWLTP